MKTTKIKELICYEENSIKVYLEIDYAYNKISIVEHTGNNTWKNKNYVFAGRGVTYMNGWKNILAVMQEAIDFSKQLYEKELAKQSAFKNEVVEYLIKKGEKKSKRTLS